MSEVFADAFYFIAMLNKADQHHAAALARSKSVTRAVVTSIWVLVEVADALSDPMMRQHAHQFLRTVFVHPKITVIAELEPWLTRGIELYGKRLDKSWSLTDCISFEIMSDRGIREALTADQHFTQAGFQILLSL